MTPQLHIGLKLINALPMTRLAYNELRGWQLPADENGDDPGYLVEYLDGGRANVPGFDGYVSWSPADVFEAAYEPSGQMSFSSALWALRNGFRVARSGWNGKGMFLTLIAGWEGGTDDHDLQGFPRAPFIALKSAQDDLVPWLCSQADMLATDYCLVPVPAPVLEDEPEPQLDLAA